MVSTRAFVWLVVLVPCLKAFTLPNHKPQPQSWLPLKSSRDYDSGIGTAEFSAENDSPINPLVMRILQETNHTNGSAYSSNILEASSGVQAWRRVLLRGRLPILLDFGCNPTWPPEPLFSALSKTMTDLQLPRFVMRHPETVTAVLITMLRMAFLFESRKTVADDEETPDDDIEEDLDNVTDDEVTVAATLSQDELDALALEIANDFVDEYSGVIQGVASLDQLFGPNHGLLDVQGVDAFGLHDGVWQHSGWSVLPSLQRQLQSMVELHDMVQALGRRPTATDRNNALYRFSPREFNAEGAMGAQFDTTPRSSVSGLTLSGSLTEMLPSEAGLLLGNSPVLRRLFLAKKVESKLLSYQLSGWCDVPSLPKANPRYRPRLPSGPGGPIVVCLDTSWSMSGSRETLSKAVVLACVSAARKQRRSCQVVAFSNERGVMDAGEITPDPAGVRRLLEFLSNSFGGGTDVTGALKYAMTKLGSDAMSAADVLLVTDGEIPDPPVKEEMMQDLDRLKRRTGMQIHGLLVGKSESKPVSKLCTHTYDFLIGYDANGNIASSKGVRSPALFASGQNGALLFEPRARQYGWGVKPLQGRGRIRYSFARSTVALQARSTRDPSQGTETYVESDGRRESEQDDDEDRGIDLSSGNSDFRSRVQGVLAAVQEQVNEAIQGDLWHSSLLYNEKTREESCWRHRDDVKLAVDSVGENLVEREEEARLLVLSVIAGEHILFLGPPGTGKSMLGSRLSKLCGGLFFQRQLTRFTTPEEIFGPLSLRALENDEYKRCTSGYLPTASIAFLDEIFKANSAILNTLLTILNERKFDNGSGVRENCPIKCVVGASNELPESDELDALYDRFLIRKKVLSVSDEGIMKILSMPTPGLSELANDGNMLPAQMPFVDGLDLVIAELSKAADSVLIGDDICALMRDLRRFMKEQLNVEVSDRRLVKAARLLKISAASHGRTCVDPIDCILLQHVLWRLPEERSAIREWLWNNLTPSSGDRSPSVSEQFRLLLEGLRGEATEAVRKTGGDVTGASGGRTTDVAAINSIHNEVVLISDALKKRSDNLSRHIELTNRAVDHLWLERDEALSMQQLLLPKAEIISKDLLRALADSRALEVALKASVVPDDLRLTVMEELWDDASPEITFTDDELSIGMKEAKGKYDIETFRKWKRARKKANK
jgi:MoxR-like ATPase